MMLVLDGGTSYDVDVETEGRGLLPTTGQRLIRTRYGSEELLHDKSVLNMNHP